MNRAKTKWAWAMAATLAATSSACGDDEMTTDTGVPTDSGMGDAEPDTGSMPDASPDATADGGADAGDGGMPGCAEDDLGHLMVVTTAADFSRAGLGVVALDGREVTMAPADLSDADSVGASALCTGYVLSRGEGEVAVMDPSDPLAVARTIDVDPAGSMGPYASNPQTVVAASPTKAYVIQQARNAVTIIDPTTSGADAVLGEIDLSDYAKSGDMDGLVDAADAIIVGDRLYVALGNYWFDSSFAIQFEGSELAVIDITTDAPVDVDDGTDGLQGIDLAGENPWRGLQYDAASGTLYVGTTGDSFAIDGQIEVVDLATSSVTGTMLAESDLSAEINGFAVISETRVFVLAGPDLVTVNPTLDTIVPELVSTAMDGLLMHRGTLWAWARGGADPGLGSFDPATGDETTPTSGRVELDLPILDVVPVP